MVWYKEGEGATSCFSIRLPVLLLVEDVGLWLLLVLGTQVYRKPVGVVVAAGSAAQLWILLRPTATAVWGCAACQYQAHNEPSV